VELAVSQLISAALFLPCAAPDKTQRLLNRACWDSFAAMAVVRRFAVAGLDGAARRAGRRGLAVGAVDETGQVKQGEHTAGVKRHYLGCAGKVANGITTVHLAYVRERAGHALIAARQWIPREHVGDPAKQQIMGLPDDLVFRTKGHLAIDLLTEVFADGVRLDFVCGDEVYGGCTQLRQYLEGRGQTPRGLDCQIERSDGCLGCGQAGPAVLRRMREGSGAGRVISWSCGLGGVGAVRPCDGFVVFASDLHASVQDAGEAAGDAAHRVVVAGAAGSQLVVIGAGAG
jgi:hypothetical protein